MAVEQKKSKSNLKLMATPGSWRLYSARKVDERFKTFEQKVLLRFSGSKVRSKTSRACKNSREFVI